MKLRFAFCSIQAAVLCLVASSVLAESLPGPLALSAGWQLQSASKASGSGADIAQTGYQAVDWYPAVVPGTVLTALVDNKIYPEPLYGENNRPDRIPESLARTAWWYRATFMVPASYAGKKVWLNFDGMNYSAEVWVNGRKAGVMRGAFARGIFEVTSLVTPGQLAAVAVLVSPPPHPGEPHEHTLADGMGKNGGISAMDGPTFLCTIGWDWIPAIRDRDTGLWQKVFLSATGPVAVKYPLISSDLPLPDLTSAEVRIQVVVTNLTVQPQNGALKGSFGGVSFKVPVQLRAGEARTVALDSKAIPQLHLRNPKLWWPNGYGPQNLYTLKLSFETGGDVSDQLEVPFGIRKITYAVADSENLTISVNGARIFCRGGNWGLDEAMKRIPRERLEAQIRMHQIANYTIIRNWVGQSTGEDFYELCDKYGLLLWDEFFQPNPGDGPNPTDLATYLANVREKILRFRNHPSIAVWCARNEGFPPKNIDDALRELMAELEPTRLYQASSTDGRGVHSNGPYRWRTPREYYDFKTNEAFKTEIGSVSIPTLESIHGMMPKKDWEIIDDDWAEHDLARGAQKGDLYPQIINDRYGKVANLADFVRKAQLADYESYRAMYEGRNAKLFNPCTGVITWMSNPAQPSFVWQLYHHDLEPNSSLFAVRKACEMVHVQLNEKTGDVEIINQSPLPLPAATARLTLYNLDGTVAYQHEFKVDAPAAQATSLGEVAWPSALSPVHFVKLELRDAKGKLISDNFYWRAKPDHPDDLRSLESLPVVTIDAKVARHDQAGKCRLTATLRNPGTHVALMIHLQLRRQDSGQRVLPVYYTDNYISLVPGESRSCLIEAAVSDLKGENPLVAVDGWNIAVEPVKTARAAVALNEDAQVNHWPVTGLPFATNYHAE
jgi:beta-mannosidase